MAYMDRKSELLRKVDLTAGGDKLTPEQYENLRRMARVTAEKNAANYPQCYKGAFKGSSQGRVDDFARIIKTRNREGLGDSGGAGFEALKPVAEFLDEKGRKTKLFYPPSGSISLQFYLLKDDDIGRFYDAIVRVFERTRVIPQGVTYEVSIVSDVDSINVYMEPQQFPLGFKTYFKAEMIKLFAA